MFEKVCECVKETEEEEEEGNFESAGMRRITCYA